MIMRVATQPVEAPSVKVATQPDEAPSAGFVVTPNLLVSIVNMLDHTVSQALTGDSEDQVSSQKGTPLEMKN